MDRAKKVVNEKHENILLELSKQPGNDTCADCGAKGPRWASYNLGIFLCMRCCGFHRKMGTHISKVKSISLDSWKPEQIEVAEKIEIGGFFFFHPLKIFNFPSNLKSMRQWGNLKANAKWNPYPELHPISISASDGEIEKYIRNKYERMAFRDNKTPQSKSSTSSTPSRRNTNDNSKNVDKGSYDLAIRQLKDMGFTDMTRNREVLATTNGNLSTAIEILCRLPNKSSKPGLPNSSTSNTSGISDTLPKSDDEKLAYLKNLGFHDNAKNREILRRTGGNVEVAATLLTENRSTASENVSSLTLSNPLQVQSQTLVGAFPSQNSGSQQSSSQNQNQAPNVWGEFSQVNVQLQQQQQQKAKLDKDAIMSLYNTPQPSVYNNTNQTPQFGISGSGMMQSPPGQFGMMQQRNQIGQFNNGMNQPPPNQTGQLGFPVQTSDFGLNNAGIPSNNVIPYGNVNQQTVLSNQAYTRIPVNNVGSLGAGDLSSGYNGLGTLGNGANPTTNYGYSGTPGLATNNFNNANAMSSMGILNRQNSIPLDNTQSTFALNTNNSNPMGFGGLASSYPTLTPNGGMGQQLPSQMVLSSIQHTGGYPNGQQNHGFQKNSLL